MNGLEFIADGLWLNVFMFGAVGLWFGVGYIYMRAKKRGHI